MSLTEKERTQAWQGITKEEYKKYVTNPEAYFDAMIKPNTSIEDSEHIQNLKYQVTRERDMRRLEALREGPDLGTRVSWRLQKISDAVEKPFTWIRGKSEYILENRMEFALWAGIGLSAFGMFQGFWFDLQYVQIILAGGIPFALCIFLGLFAERDDWWNRAITYTTLLWTFIFTMIFVFTPSVPAYLLVKQSQGQREVIVSRETWITRAPSLLAGDRVRAYKDENSEIAKCEFNFKDGLQIRVIGKRNLIMDNVLPVLDKGIDYEFQLSNFNHIMYAETKVLGQAFSESGRITQAQCLGFVEKVKNDLFFVSDVKVEVHEIGRDEYGKTTYKRIF